MSKKLFNFQNDVLFATSRINEHIRFTTGTMGLTGTLNTGTVLSPNVRTYSHWTSGSITGSLYQSVYDKDSRSISSNRLFDVTFGSSVSSSVAVTPGTTNIFEKQRVYRQFAQKLLGRADAQFVFQGTQRNELIFICLSRNQYKDQIKHGSFEIKTVFSGNVADPFSSDFLETRTFTDAESLSAIDETSAGKRGFLTLRENEWLVGQSYVMDDQFGVHAGAVYYDAGTIVLVPELISATASNDANAWFFSGAVTGSYLPLVSGSGFTYEDVLSGVRQRLLRIEFLNQTNVRTTFYKCVAERHEFNYSSNPTFRDGLGQIYTTSGSEDRETRTFISKIVLLGKNDEKIAIGVLNRPVRKDPDLKVEIKVRINY